MRLLLALTVLGLALAFALVFAGCPHPLPPPGPGAEAGTATCADVCAHARELGCEAAKPTPKGASCEAVCANVQGSGAVNWDLVCRAHAPSCADIDRCEGGGR